jgi:WD40 repeat protein
MCLDFSPDDSLLISGSYDKSVKLFSTKDWTILQDWKEHSNYVRAVLFHHTENQVVVSGSLDNSIKVWNPS